MVHNISCTNEVRRNMHGDDLALARPAGRRVAIDAARSQLVNYLSEYNLTNKPPNQSRRCCGWGHAGTTLGWAGGTAPHFNEGGPGAKPPMLTRVGRGHSSHILTRVERLAQAPNVNRVGRGGTEPRMSTRGPGTQTRWIEGHRSLNVDLGGSKGTVNDQAQNWVVYFIW